MGWWLGWWLVALVGQAESQAVWTGRETSEGMASISPYSPWDRAATLAFTRGRPPSALEEPEPWLSFPLWIYTDAPDLWTPSEINLVLAMTRWYFGACKIGLDLQGIAILPLDRLIQREPLVFSLPLRLSRMPRKDETLAFLTRRVHYRWGKQVFRLLGLSVTMRLLDRKGQAVDRPVVWTRASPIYTTLAHEIGHRLGLPHTTLPRNLMLNGPGVVASARNLWTSIGGFFSPRDFGFTATQCLTMRQTLQNEQRSIRPLTPLLPASREVQRKLSKK